MQYFYIYIINKKIWIDMAELKLITEIKEKAKAVKRTIVLPESHDDRVLKAAEKLTKEGIAKVITIRYMKAK
jgi:hypothetical protein